VGLRAIPLDVQGVEEKKEAEQCFCKGNKHTKIIPKCCFLGCRGQSICGLLLFVGVLEHNSHEK